VADQRELEARVEELPERGYQGEEEQAEGDHHGPVRRADPPLSAPGQPGVAEELAHQVLRAGDRVAGAAGSRLPGRDQPVHPGDDPSEQREADHGYAQGDDDRGDVHG
jgi:hypothetical protein